MTTGATAPSRPKIGRIGRSEHMRNPGDCANSPGAWPTLSRSIDVTDRTCGVPECERALYARSWCSLHYSRWRAHGSTGLPTRERITGVPCAADSCEKPAVGRGWCAMHWYRWKTHGSVDLPRQVHRPKDCSEAECGRAADVSGSARGLCPKHYQRKNPRLRTRSRASSQPKPKRTPKVCEFADCTRRPVAKELCNWHYQLARDSRQAACSVADCDSPGRAKGLCANHYAYVRRHGVPTQQYVCQGCQGRFPGRANTLHCAGCKPAPNAYATLRKIRLAANNAGMTGSDHEVSLEYQRILRADPCVYCGTTSTAIDHIAPVVEGGSDRWENLAPVCKSCNSRKRSRSVLTVMLGRLVAS